MKYEVVHEFPGRRTEIAWRALLSRVELPSHYDAPEYFLEPFWAGKKPFAVLAVEGDTACAVVTGIHRGEHVICGLPARPQIAIDPEIDRVAALNALEEGLIHEAERAKTITIYSWPHVEMSPLLASGFRQRQLQGNVVLDLTLGAENLFQQFAKDRRRNIRFAEKNGVSVRIATTREDFLRAYDVYLAWVDAKSTEAKGERRTFENFEAAQKLSGNRRLFLAESSGSIIAINTFRFYPGGLFESAANFSLDEFLHLKPNDLLQWRGIEWACSQGFRRHSLGGAHPFLTRFGGTIVPVLRYRLDRTLLRQHDLQEMIEDTVRKTMKRMPPTVQAGVRRALGKAH
jgi:Acetyltransferase (GNAT) domain